MLTAFLRDGIYEKRAAEDLQFDRLCELLAPNRLFKLSSQELGTYFTVLPEEIKRRQAALRDLLNCTPLRDACMALLEAMEVWTAHTGVFQQEQTPGAPNLSEYVFLSSFLKAVERLNKQFSDCSGAIGSDYLRSVAAELLNITCSEEMRQAAVSYASLTTGAAVAGTIRLGVNLSEDLEPRDFKLLSLDERSVGGKKTTLAGPDAMTAGTLAAQAAVRGSSEISAFVRHFTARLTQLRSDLILLLSGAALADKLKAADLPCCFAECRPVVEKQFAAEDLINPLLLLNGTSEIVASSIALEPEGELLLLTGANQGGKTTFLQSVGLNQWLFQLGLPIAARSGSISPCGGIVTVFASRERVSAAGSLLTQELSLIAEAIDKTRSDSLLLLNEPLNATSPAENLSISKEVITALSAARVRGIWVTHIYELASQRSDFALPGGSKLGSIRVEVDETSEGFDPSYKVIRGEPEGSSYAGEVLRRKGVCL